MFGIGDFARHGRVSVRMLRHYDAIGLLRPAHVDPASNYRSYTASQLAQLNHIVALKDLGFTLEQVRTMLHEQVGVEQARGMLVLRRAQLEAAIAEDAARLAQVEARLTAIETEGRLPAEAVVVKHLAASRMVELTAVAASFRPEDIGPVVHPLCAELGARLADAPQLNPNGRLTCYYERRPHQDDEVVVHAAVPAAPPRGADLNGLAVADLPAVDAATTVHRGSMAAVLPAWQGLARWVEANGYRSSGHARELYLATPGNLDEWVTELHEPVVPS